MVGGTRSRRGLTPVVSSIIMCAVVLVIGVSVWGVASSSSSIMQTDYFEEVMESVEKIKERFCVENVGYNDTTKTLKIWVVNYGEIDVNVTVIRIEVGGNFSYYHPPDGLSKSPPNGVLIPSGGLGYFNADPSGLSLVGKSVSIRVDSERGNKAYASLRILEK